MMVTETPSVPSVWELYCHPVRRSMRALSRRVCHSSGSNAFCGRCALRVGLIDSMASICAWGKSASGTRPSSGPAKLVQYKTLRSSCIGALSRRMSRSKPISRQISIDRVESTCAAGWLCGSRRASTTMHLRP